jgi:hypothetical protein|tara:strand:- start:714 stop:1277 length:564 start_codon:yes stop_codon:yes gene_type:complete
MKDERKGVSKDDMVKSAKENAELVKFIASLTKEEIERIKEVREYDLIEPGTPTYKIALMCDSLRQDLQKNRADVAKRLWSIDDMQNNIKRLKIQITTGNITEKLPKSGEPMNEAELKSLITHHEWMKDGEFFYLYKLLGQIRGVVGHRDVGKHIIMTQKAFDDYVLQIAEGLKKYGYNLFGDLEAKS